MTRLKVNDIVTVTGNGFTDCPAWVNIVPPVDTVRGAAGHVAVQPGRMSDWGGTYWVESKNCKVVLDARDIIDGRIV